MSEEMAVYTAENTAITSSSELDSDVLKEFLTSWKQGGQTVTTFTAKGIQYIAQELGISIVSSEFKECSDGNGFYFTAESKNINTGQTYVAHLYQPKHMKRGGKEVFDPDAVAKGSTRVNRNALTGLIPTQILKHRVQNAIRKGEVEESEVLVAQKAARQAMETNRHALKEQFDITPTEAFEMAQERLGSVEDWDSDDWRGFERAVKERDANWFSA